MLVLGEPDYPPMLALLEDAPPAIAVLGDPALLSRRAVGLVGARNASANGQRMAETLAAELASQAILVVSGLARGIDTAAHTGALHTGQTAAAVAGGLDMPYPPENAKLQARIAEQGVVIAEAPLGTAPQSRHFPRRNRIIAGLSLGLVVVEAAAQLRQPDHGAAGVGRPPRRNGDPRLAAGPALPRVQRPNPRRRHPGRPGRRRDRGAADRPPASRTSYPWDSRNLPNPGTRPSRQRTGHRRNPRCAPCSGLTPRRLTI